MDAAALVASLELALPEVMLALGAMSLLLFGAFSGDKSGRLILPLSVLLLVSAGVGAAVLAPGSDGVGFNGAFVLDPLARFAKIVIAFSAAAALAMAGDYLRDERLNRFEFPVLIVLSVLGMMLMVSARDLLTLYLGVELQSLPLYVLAAFNRDSLRASEAGLKYFVLGALSSGLLLYGASLTYGFTGSLLFVDIAAAASEEASIGLIFGLVFLMSGLAFKVSAAPFHMWTPDVYEGAPTPVTAFFSAAPKMAAMILFTRVLFDPFGDLLTQWRQVIVVLAVFSMVVGAYGALTQTNIKRLMAYSSIANMGFALVPLAAGTQSGVRGMLIYMTIYVITSIGIFACILSMRRREGMVESLDDLAGLSRTHQGLALALTMLLFSVAGIPPLAGFFGKLFAFIPAAEAGLWWLVIVAVLASVVTAFYYLRLIKIIWFDAPGGALVAAPRRLALIAGGAAAAMFPVLILPLVSAPALAYVDRAAASLF